MDHATSSRLLLATHFATSLLPLTARLVPVITELGRLIVTSRRADPSPRDCPRFETRLQALLRELGRIIVEWTFNHREPHDRKDLPGPIESGGIWSRRRSKTPNRSVATTVGTITVWRMLSQDVHGVEPSIFPLEIRLGLECGRATPALAEPAARAAVTSSQDVVPATLRDDHAVRWSATTLRAVIAGVAVGLEAQRHDAQADRLRARLEPADRSSGDRQPVLAVGRDGLMLPIPGQACYREGATATVSVYDRRGQRLGTVSLGRMPEPGQGTLSRPLTALIAAVLRGWAGPSPRLADITDGGNHPTQYDRRLLRRMSDPRHPGRRLEWRWVIDSDRACESITKLSEALFSDARAGASWARKLRRWLKERPRGIYRVLHAAAALRRRIIAAAAKREPDRTAYAALRKRMRWLDYRGYRRDHRPIGSGVTAAACKTVFTQRLKQSGMTWKVESGQWIVELRVIHLSGVWSEVYQSYLGSKATLQMRTQPTTAKRKTSNAA